LEKGGGGISGGSTLFIRGRQEPGVLGGGGERTGKGLFKYWNETGGKLVEGGRKGLRGVDPVRTRDKRDLKTSPDATGGEKN